MKWFIELWNHHWSANLLYVFLPSFLLFDLSFFLSFLWAFIGWKGLTPSSWLPLIKINGADGARLASSNTNLIILGSFNRVCLLLSNTQTKNLLLSDKYNRCHCQSNIQLPIKWFTCQIFKIIPRIKRRLNDRIYCLTAKSSLSYH